MSQSAVAMKLSRNNMNYDNMSNKERSDRQRIQAQREMKKRQHESELRRKRDRLTMMESSEKKI